MTPVRIQLRRTRGWRKPVGAVVVSRPSKWGNPFRVGELDVDGLTPMSAARAVERFRLWIADKVMLNLAKTELRGKDLACWCRLPKKGEPDVCHAIVLLAVANEGDDAE